MQKKILFINISQQQLLHPLTMDFSLYDIPIKPERYVYSATDILDDISNYKVHSMNYTETTSINLDEIKTMVRRVTSSLCIFYIDNFSRIFSHPSLIASEDPTSLLASWVEVFNGIDTKKRRHSLICIDRTILPLNTIYFILKEVIRYKERHKEWPHNLSSLSTKTRIKKWGAVLDQIIQRQRRLEMNKFSLRPLEKNSVIYLENTFDDQEIITEKNYLFNQLLTIEDTPVTFVEHDFSMSNKPAIDELALDFMYMTLGVFISNRPRLLELLHHIQYEEVTVLYLFSLDDLSTDEDILHKILVFIFQKVKEIRIIKPEDRGVIVYGA